MKYLITESQQENVIKKFILSNFDRVTDVLFETKTVFYGSGKVSGNDRGERTTIISIVDNTNPETELNNIELNQLKREIIRLTDKTFNLEYDRYGSNWNFKFLKKELSPF